MRVHDLDLSRSPLAWTGLLLAGLVAATLLVLPLAHGALHAPGAPESECPVHILQAGFALVLLALIALGPRAIEPVVGLSPVPAPGVCGNPRRASLSPRAPPYILHLSQ